MMLRICLLILSKKQHNLLSVGHVHGAAEGLQLLFSRLPEAAAMACESWHCAWTSLGLLATSSAMIAPWNTTQLMPVPHSDL